MTAAPTDAPDILIAVGSLLAAPSGVTGIDQELAAALGVNDRSVRRWLAGTVCIPAGVIADLDTILADHVTDVESLRARLRHLANGSPT